MTKEQHKKRHELLHRHLDELLGDFILQTGHYPSSVSLMTLLKWSYQQTKNPTQYNALETKEPDVSILRKNVRARQSAYLGHETKGE